MPEMKTDMRKEKQVLVIGGGIAGLSAAHELSKANMGVVLVETETALGGHARQFTCKAAESCVKCGACIVEEKLDQVASDPNINVLLGSRVNQVTRTDRFSVAVLNKEGSSASYGVDAVVVASGFLPFDPIDKPYGYKKFDNVITNLELERILRQSGLVKRPSDNLPPKQIGFVQCVGSRDSKLKHLWCSKICCGSALRMARRIKSKQPETEITFFYIDIQTFGKNFQRVYSEAHEDVRMIRAIPGDVFSNDNGKLRVTYFDTPAGKPVEAVFDLLVLSVGILPGKDLPGLSGMLGFGLNDFGFASSKAASAHGVFIAGTALGPMSIAETVASAGKTAMNVIKFIENKNA